MAIYRIYVAGLKWQRSHTTSLAIYILNVWGIFGYGSCHWPWYSYVCSPQKKINGCSSPSNTCRFWPIDDELKLYLILSYHLLIIQLYNYQLIGGSNPTEQYESQIGSSSQLLGKMLQTTNQLIHNIICSCTYYFPWSPHKTATNSHTIAIK